jgi:hypothetical protein
MERVVSKRPTTDYLGQNFLVRNRVRTGIEARIRGIVGFEPDSESRSLMPPLSLSRAGRPRFAQLLSGKIPGPLH